MDIAIKSKNGPVANDLQAYTSQKLVKLGKFNQRILSIAITFTEDNSKKKEMQCRAEFQLNLPGQVLHAHETAENCRSAVDLGIETLKKLLVKETDKRSTKLREAAETVKDVVHSAVVSPAPVARRRNSKALLAEAPAPRITSERYAAKPLSLEDAIKELDLARRDFLVFINQTGAVNCVYRRGKNQFGLLEPEERA